MKSKMRFISIGLICLMFASCTGAAKAEKKEDFYSQITRAVIRLEHCEIDRKEGSLNVNMPGKSVGTAFFVNSEGHLFVVSARHVVERSYDLYARVNCLHRKSGQRGVILLRLPRKRWCFHPIEGDENTYYVDVAAMQIRFHKGWAVKHFGYELPNSNNEDKNQLPREDPKPPRRIYVFGFPGDIGFQLLEQRPFARTGIVAMQTGKQFLKFSRKETGEKKFAEEKCYVIDAKLSPGNSGSPVLNQKSLLEKKPLLLGLVIAANPTMDFAIVEPVSRIREVLDIAKNQKDEDITYWIPLKK